MVGMVRAVTGDRIVIARNEAHGFTIEYGDSPVWVPAFKTKLRSENWYCLPSWRVLFDEGPLASIDCRIHKSLGQSHAWELAEATTGFIIHSGYEEDEIDECSMQNAVITFCVMVRPKITDELLAKALATARARLADFVPCPQTQPREIKP